MPERRPRGRPDFSWQTIPEIERRLAERRALKVAGPLRAQAALSLLHARALPAGVVAEAQRRLRDREYAHAQRAYDAARRGPADAAAARRERNAAFAFQPAAVTVARYLAKQLPSRPRGSGAARLTAAHAVEAETRRLARLDAHEGRYMEQVDALSEDLEAVALTLAREAGSLVGRALAPALHAGAALLSRAQQSRE